MEGWFKILSLYILIVYATGLPYAEDSKDYEDNYGNSDDDTDNDADNEIYYAPKFQSESSHMMVNEGETVRLPCLVDKLEGFVLMWKRDTNILTVQYQIIDKRFRLEDLGNNGNHLILSQVTPEDAGSYVCQIAAWNQPEIVHNISVRTVPVIQVTSSEEIRIKEGDNLTLGCELISGSPTPNLNWIYSSAIASSVTKIEEKASLDIPNIRREMSGEYKCVADNGLTATKTVNVQIEYPPSIEISESFIVSDMAEQQEIECKVESQPLVSNVEWTHEGVLLSEDNPMVSMSTKSGEMNQYMSFTLTIPEVNLNSTGEYTCTASNSVGTDERSALVTGEAEPVTILNESNQSDQEDRFTIRWSVASKSPVDRWVVGLRKKGDDKWEYMEVELGGDDANDTDAVDAAVGNATDAVGNATDVTDAVAYDGGYTGEIELTGLDAGTEYQVTVATSNSFGLGKHGDIYTFSTKQPENIVPEKQPIEEKNIKEQQQKAVKTSSSESIRPLIILLAIACFNSKL